MDEIEYKLKTKNSVLIVNAIEKLISTIKSKYKPGERQKFVVENEELKYLREKCSSEDSMVSLTACQGLLALVELGVLEIAHTMSTVVTLLPTTHNYSAIISTMAGLLILDLKSRLTPGQPYKCQFSLRSPQHPFITVLEKNKKVEDEILVQMQALCNHPEYTVASNSLELLRPVFLWLTCSPHSHGIRPWQLLLSLPQTAAQSKLLLACISCQQICNSKQIEQAFAAYSVVCDAAIYQQRREHVMAFLPMLARVAGELVNHGRDPRGCYNLIERCFALDAPELKVVAGFTIMLLAKNLMNISALYLHELFNLCLNIISKYEYSKICLSSFVGLSLQWLHLPSYLTKNALKVASKILDLHQNEHKIETGLYMMNLKANTIFQSLLYIDKDLYLYYKLLEMWEKGRDSPELLKGWFNRLTESDDVLKIDLFTFFVGVAMSYEDEEVNLKATRAIIDLVRVKKEISVSVLPVLMYKIANDKRPNVKLECLRGLPLMATTKENVPALVSVLNKLKANKGVPTSLLIMLYTSLAETQVRCFPYLLELLVDTTVRPDELKWEIDVAKAVAVKRICEIRPSTNGLEVVSVISSILNRCTERAGAAASGAALAALARLWRAAAVAPPGAWRALAPRLAADVRPLVQIRLCELLSEIPALRVATPEYEQVLAATAARLWRYVAESDLPAVIHAACSALANYKLEDYKLKDIPEIYRRTVKLPPSYCKTPIDAARKPEDVLDYIPCKFNITITTKNALKVASKILDLHQNEHKIETGLYMMNLKANTIFQSLLYIDKDLYLYYKLLEMWEKGRDSPELLKGWFNRLTESDDVLKIDLFTFFVGVAMSYEDEEVNLKATRAIIDLVRVKKEISVSVLPVLMYKIANDKRPNVKLECLRGLPLMATTKENVPALVSVLNKLKANKGVPTSLLIMLYTSLAETQVRCFPYLLELLVDTTVRPDELKWEIDVAKAVAVKRICEIRPSTNGLEVVSVISSILNRCTERAGAAASGAALAALARLWRAAAVAPPGAWRALAPRLAADVRPLVQIRLCELLSEIPALRVATPEYEQVLAATAARLWRYVAESDLPAVIHAACSALANYKLEDYKLKDIPEIYRRTVKLPPSYCKTPIDAARKPEDVLDYIPCEIWPEVFKSTAQSGLRGVEQLASRLAERELRALRRGVYQQAREPPAPAYLPAASVVRGLLDGFRRQVTSPSYDYSDAVLLSMLSTLTADYCKPLPPLDLSFLHEVFHRGAAWKAGSVKLAARQAHISGSGRRLVDNFLLNVVPGTCEQSDIMLFFENLPILCRTMPPNSIRPPLERCLADSFSHESKDPENLFIQQLAIIRECLENDRIHDANRTLLSQIVENYFSVIDDDHVAWPAYVETCRTLSTKYLERMTSPSGWWEVTGSLLRKTVSVRSRLAALPDITAPLVWLNEAIDAHAECITEQEYSLRCMQPALRAAAAAPDTKDWFLQLLARTQVAFNETEEESAKQYLVDVFSLAVISFSGLWALEPDAQMLVSSRSARAAALPAAAAALAARPGWDSCTPQLLEWLVHTRARGAGAAACEPALLALRHTEPFTTLRVWTRIETTVDSSTIAVEDE